MGAVEIYIEVKGKADEVIRAIWPTGIPGELRREIKFPEKGTRRLYDYQFIPGLIQTPASNKPIQSPISLSRIVQREHAKLAIRHLWPDGKIPREKERKRLIDQYCLSQGWELISIETIGRALRELGGRKQPV